MGLLSSRKAMLGMVLMIVGTIGMLPGMLPAAKQMMTVALVPGALALTLGTWMVGTSEGGRPV
ncbi:hypothetical protein E6P09_14510 [Haloferax mediterranei ATCC 33500]|uniref:Uncharacterized protein n=1 Tax=Haloferax mediterranei (strain ATCC 33500 / DSM 1411 / JCM 8866 / NBRC 14739 / NCIMB 2177 / R-4) TaxID=523841 RepID=I3R7D0_HALMT|nr:hypothetical protein [Haloferax mediterranei]AFK20140.1 hypothetical protein HFX_2455 [Haloferax mediterranei ATCC 33500]AHZ23514.1 hypothetical protein BM92_13070 [Haloferax mediterranei ATCC 33500]ELZ99688.1 hypothetical protein C439_14079 [Haloferax mediterranei ATCC 33500]MDX5987108.1 hypothetical protein [Haloferax mediterranei ATCC 33500]QCQ76422.1 hypothetical protein E6P09_14510 [Haloferax mediterranei ATCC 33500]